MVVRAAATVHRQPQPWTPHADAAGFRLVALVMLALVGTAFSLGALLSGTG